ncbi:MAG: hypothetical protein AAF772_14975, partial [Acidobacteriota bacterium]
QALQRFDDKEARISLAYAFRALMALSQPWEALATFIELTFTTPSPRMIIDGFETHVLTCLQDPTIKAALRAELQQRIARSAGDPTQAQGLLSIQATLRRLTSRRPR